MIRAPLQRFAAAVFLVATTAFACQVPVFRYALERWSADAYQLDVLYSDSLPSDLSGALAAIESRPVNVKVRTFDLEKLSETDQWRIGDLPQASELPSFRLRSPDVDRGSKVLWEAAATTESLDSIIDSPVRQRIVSELASGVSAIWFIVPGIEKSESLDDTEQQLRNILKQISGSMELPEGVINAGEIDNAKFRPEQPIDLDDVLRSHVPLKLDFKVQRLDSYDPEEQVTIKLLKSLLPPEGGVVPVFGRGRALPGIPLSRIDPDVLKRAAEYIAGSCSCQVKAENPGIDLLVHADWDAMLNDQLVVSSRDLPPLEGIAIVKNEEPVAANANAQDISANGDLVSERANPLQRNMLIAAVAFLVASVVGGFLLGRSNS